LFFGFAGASCRFSFLVSRYRSPIWELIPCSWAETAPQAPAKVASGSRSARNQERTASSVFFAAYLVLAACLWFLWSPRPVFDFLQSSSIAAARSFLAPVSSITNHHLASISAPLDIEKLFSKLKSHELSCKGHPNYDASLTSNALITSARVGGHDANPTNTVSSTLEFVLSSLAAAFDELY
jgi:hypothetical protein